MAKRITESRVLAFIGSASVPVGIALIMLLINLGSIEIIDYTKDINCGDKCWINVTFTAKEDIFLYPMDASLLTFDNPEAITKVQLYRTWGSGLRKIDLNKTCNGPWCGCYWCTTSNTAQFTYVFRKDKNYTLVYEIDKHPSADIKWSWFDGAVDPLLIGAKNSDSIFNELKENNAKDKKAKFNLDSPSNLKSEDLTVYFKEVCGKIKSYKFYTSNTCIKTVETPVYDITNKCNATDCFDVYTLKNTVKTQVNYTCEVPITEVKYGKQDYILRADIEPENKNMNPNCSSEHMGYQIEWIPQLKTLSGDYSQVKWAWWNFTQATVSGYYNNFTSLSDFNNDWTSGGCPVTGTAAWHGKGKAIWNGSKVGTNTSVESWAYLNITRFSLQNSTNYSRWESKYAYYDITPAIEWTGTQISNGSHGYFFWAGAGNGVGVNIRETGIGTESSILTYSSVGQLTEDEVFYFGQLNNGTIYLLDSNRTLLKTAQSSFVLDSISCVSASGRWTGYLPYINITVGLSGSALKFNDFYDYNITAELGTIINVTITIVNESPTCLDIDHRDFGVNYTCADVSLNQEVNMTYFSRNQDNLSRKQFNMTYEVGGAENQTFNITAHQWDEIHNLTINLTGFEESGFFPSDVIVYVNDTISNTVGDFSGNVTTLNSTESIENFSMTGIETKIVQYLRLPKTATVTSSRFNVTGFTSGWCYQESTNVATSCGGKSGGTVDISSCFDSPSKLIDANYNTADACDQGFPLSGTFRPDYEKADNATEYRWQIKADNEYFNFTLPTACINPGFSSTKIRVIDSIGDGGTPHNFACFTGPSTTSSLGTKTGGTISEEAIYFRGNLSDVYIEVGNIDGTRDFNHTGMFVGLESNVTEFNTPVNDFLVNCTADLNGFCYVPIHVSSQSLGIIQIDKIEIIYTNAATTVEIDTTLVKNYVGNMTNHTTIPIKIQSSTTGILQVDDIRYNYAGGNDSIRFLVHSDDYVTNQSLNVTYYYSDWDYVLPPNIQYLEFIPQKANSSNVTPYGQRSQMPFLNITTYNYGGRDMNISILLNETFSCVNLTASEDSDKDNGSQLTPDTWLNLTDNLQDRSNVQTWFWADYNCTFNQWYLWYPTLYFRGCCEGCTVCDTDVS